MSSIHHKVSEQAIRDDLYRQFRQFDDVSIKVVFEHDGERVAYVYFRSSADARDAKHVSRGRLMFYDKPALVEPVYETAPPDYRLSPRATRSRTPHMVPPHLDYPPIDMRHYLRHRSPPPPSALQPPPPHEFERFGPLPPHHHHHHPLHEPYGYDLPPGMHEPYPLPRGFAYREPPRAPPFPPYGAPPYGPPYGGGGGGRPRFDRHDRKERFPNYLHHVAPEDDPTACRTLFAGNMELNITEEEIRRIFGRYGSVEDVDIKRPPPGTGNAFAFVRFDSLQQSYKCKLELSGQYIGKFQVKIGYGKPLPSCRVWVGNLASSGVSLSLLEREFDRFGAIRHIDYTRGSQHAHVLYETLDAAQAAVSEMRGVALAGSDKRLRTDFAPDPSAVHFTRRGENGRAAGGQHRRPGAGSGNNHRERQSTEREPSVADTAGPGDESDGSAEPTEAGPDGVQDKAVGRCASLTEVAQCVGCAWHGCLVLKSSMFACRLHVVSGHAELASTLLSHSSGQPHLLRITQRLRLDQPKLDDVQKRIASSTHAVFVALPCSEPPPSSSGDSAPPAGVQLRSLRNLVSYLRQKEAAGVTSLSADCQPGEESAQTAGVLYAFPPCPFSRQLLVSSVPALSEEACQEDHLLVVVVRGGSV